MMSYCRPFESHQQLVSACRVQNRFARKYRNAFDLLSTVTLLAERGSTANPVKQRPVIGGAHGKARLRLHEEH